MRLANRFRPQRVINATTRVNSKKNAKRLAANYALLKELAAADAPKAKKAAPKAKKAAAPKAEKAAE